MFADTMMYVRNMPWSGLGTEVKEAPTSADAIKLAGLNWEVEGRPIYDGQGREIPGFIANTRTDNDEVLGMVTKRYQIVQNHEAFAFTDELLKNPDVEVKYETAGCFKGGKQVWLLARMPEQEILGDEVDPYLCFMNTYDGSGSIKICMTPVRVWCSNTLNLALKTAKRSWTTKHVGDITFKMEEARQTLGMAQDYMKALNEEAQVLVDTKVESYVLEELIDNMFPVNAETSERKIRNVDAMKQNLFNCYDMADIAKFKGTAWGALNAVSDFVSHVQPARMTETYQANNWSKIMVGHQMLDNMYSMVR